MSRHISSAGRTRMLDKIRKALDDGSGSPARRQAVEARLARPPVHLQPARNDKPHEGLVEQFRQFLEGQFATVLEVATREGVPQAVSGWLRQHNLPQRVRTGTDPWLAALPWSGAASLERAIGPATLTDDVGVSRARAGIAETGTLVLTSGADNPVTVTFLPENHVVVLEAKDVVGSYEQAWVTVRAALGTAGMSRTVNFVSGPSRTGDIGGKLVMGAHGPRRLCVVLVRS